MAFESLKKAFTSTPILAHVDTEKPFIIEADASDFALGSILSQQGDDEKLHLVAFHSRKFDAAKINYEIHDKELLAIVDSFMQWRHFLEGSPNQVTVFSDHQNLAYFQNAHVLNRRQTHFDSFRLQNYISSGEARREDRCIVTTLIFSTASFDNKKHVFLGPARLQAI